MLDRFLPREYQEDFFDAMENSNGKYKHAIIVHPRRCLSGNSIILMADGSPKLLKDIEPGDKILSWDGTGFVQDIVKNKWSTGVKDTFVLKSPKYDAIVTSGDHVFAYTHTHRKSFKWNKVTDLPKRALLFNYGGSSNGSKHDLELAEFLGYMTGDGYVSGYQQPKFTNTNTAILDRVEYLATKLFNCTVIRRAKGNGYDLGFSNGTKGGGTFKNEIKELFRSYGQDIPKSQSRLLGCVWEFDEQSIIRFLCALISADGSMYVAKQGFTAQDTGRVVPPGMEISFHCGKSALLAQDIYWLLRKIGIVPQVIQLEKESNHKVRVSNSRDIKKLLGSCPVYGKEARQQELLAAANQCTKETTLHKGCYLSGYTLTPGFPEELYDIETEKHHNFVANGYVVHNSGKDVMAFHFAVRHALRKTTTVLYMLKSFSQCKQVIWDMIMNDGTKLLDTIPPECIESMNVSELKITFKNGSIIKLGSAENYEKSIVGSNATLIIFSEYATYDNDNAYLFASPIMAANDGRFIFISTPRSRNFYYDLWMKAQEWPDWYCELKTVEDTKHISPEMMNTIEREHSYEFIQQEYYCSFSRGIEGSVYAHYINKMRDDGRIGNVPYDPSLLVNTAFDLGQDDQMVIVLFQITKQNLVNIINCYADNNKPMTHYIKWLKEQEYVYGKHWAPHDAAVRDLTTGQTRIEYARQLGITFETREVDGKLQSAVPRKSILDGIEAVRVALPRISIDQNKCARLIKALETYHRKWDAEKNKYSDVMVHDWSSDYSDAVRYMCLVLDMHQQGMTEADARRLNQGALYGNSPQLSDPFNNNNNNYGGRFF
jgi:phage terminase large subunit